MKNLTKTKTKFSIIAVILLMVFTTNVACQEEDINLQEAKKEIKQNQQSKFSLYNEIKLTSDNYVTENSMHISSLEQELATIAVEKKKLLAAIQKGDKNAEKEFSNLVTKEKGRNIQLNAVLDLEAIFSLKPKPNPCPQPEFCFPKEFLYLVKLDTEKIQSFTVYKNGKVVGNKVSEAISLKNYKGLDAVKISMDNLEGDGYINITKIDSKNRITSYSLNVDIQ